MKTIIRRAIEKAIEIANDDSHGYDQAERWGENYDCSSLLITCYQSAGADVYDKGATYTGNMYSAFKKCGFEDVTASVDLSSGAGLEAGDVLLEPKKHTVLYIGSGKIVSASINEKGTTTGGESGDQNGQEIAVKPYYNYPWRYVLRYTQGEDEEPKTSNNEYIVVSGDTLSALASKFGTTVQAIAQANGIKNPDLIFVGQRLTIPAAVSEIPKTFSGFINTVKDPLNIRKAPSVNADKVGKLPRHSTAQFIDEDFGGWYKLADGRGYCSAKYVKKT